jgi:uncharacterized protein (TIGR02391 family)
MSNNKTIIKLINELKDKVDEPYLNFGGSFKHNQKALDNIYKRAINISEEIIYPNQNQKLKLIGCFIRYPFAEEAELLIAIDRLKIFLSDMLDYVQANGNSQANLWNLVNKNIVELSMKKFEDGHYADAVESAFKSVNKCVKDLVKAKTGNEMDGVSLMREAFGFNLQKDKHPIILLDDLEDESGKNIQEGYMQIFAGSMQGIRNPKAHDNIDISKERAMHQIILASLLMHKLDERRS